jgi:two-component system LytT family response regulator
VCKRRGGCSKRPADRRPGDELEEHGPDHAGGEMHLINTSLAELLARLDPEAFRQVHRSHVVNLDAVAKLVPYDSRRLLIRLRDGTEILASRSASEMLRALVR